MSKIVLLNDLYPEMDKDMNGEFYDMETVDTAVIYRVLNIGTLKSYIGKAFSYEKHGKKKQSIYGAKGRFKRHWSNKDSESAQNDCPIFYKALRNSHIHDWFIFTLKVCSKKHLKEWETKLVKEYKTSNPAYGYNYFVGDNKPDNETYLATYQSNKAKSNVNRAVNGKLKRKGHSKDLPSNINYRAVKRKGKVVSEGYFVQIKIADTLYNKAFLSMSQTMPEKLELAKSQLEAFKKEATGSTKKRKVAGANSRNYSGSKTNKKTK